MPSKYTSRRRKALDEVENRLEDGFDAMGSEFVRIARSRVASQTKRGTGALLKGVTFEIPDVGARRVVLRLKSEAPYSKYVEFGFHHWASPGRIREFVKARPFFRVGVESIKRRWRTFFGG